MNIEPGDCVYRDWSGNDQPTHALPFPTEGFLRYKQAHPPGETTLHWYPDRVSAVQAIEDREARERIGSGREWVDTTPEGSIGSGEEAVYAATELPRPLRGWHEAALAQEMAL